MSTKNLARTAIEVGRRSYNKWERNYSHKQERARTRQYLSRVAQDPEEYDRIVARKRPVVTPNQDDKLNPVERFIRSRVGQKWDDVRSEIAQRFDGRTIPGRHILYDHILRHMVTYWYEEHGYRWGDFIVDENGILTENLEARRRHRYNRQRWSSAESQKFWKWLGENRIITSGSEVFWADPNAWGWEPCQRYYSGYGYSYIKTKDRCMSSKHEERVSTLGEKKIWHRYPWGWRQGKKLSRKDREYWNSLPEGLQKQGLHVSCRDDNNVDPYARKYWWLR